MVPRGSTRKRCRYWVLWGTKYWGWRAARQNRTSQGASAVLAIRRNPPQCVGGDLPRALDQPVGDFASITVYLQVLDLPPVSPQEVAAHPVRRKHVVGGHDVAEVDRDAEVGPKPAS